MAWPSAPSVTAASPVSTAPRRERGSIRRAQAADRIEQVEGGPDGALGIVLVGDRCAPDRHDGVPMNFSIVPP